MFKVPTPIRARTTFRLPRNRVLSVYIERMGDVFLVRNQLKIIKPVVRPVQILMVDLKSALNRAVKSFPHSAVNADMLVFTAYTRRKMRVPMSIKTRFYWPHRGVAAPSFAVFNGEHGGYASVQERRNIRQFTPVIQHLFGFNNLFGGKPFSARNTADVSKITDFIQRFTPQHRLPMFHNMPHLTYMQSNCIYVKGQA